MFAGLYKQPPDELRKPIELRTKTRSKALKTQSIVMQARPINLVPTAFSLAYIPHEMKEQQTIVGRGDLKGSRAQTSELSTTARNWRGPLGVFGIQDKEAERNKRDAGYLERS